jgi:hypothetical protein
LEVKRPNDTTFFDESAAAADDLLLVLVPFLRIVDRTSGVIAGARDAIVEVFALINQIDTMLLTMEDLEDMRVGGLSSLWHLAPFMVNAATR